MAIGHRCLSVVHVGNRHQRKRRGKVEVNEFRAKVSNHAQLGHLQLSAQELQSRHRALR